MKIPGAVYSCLIAVGMFTAGWIVDYFTTGAGAGVPWAPILIAAIPVVLKLFTAAGEETPEMASRGVEPAQRRGYVSKVLWG